MKIVILVIIAIAGTLFITTEIPGRGTIPPREPSQEGVAPTIEAKDYAKLFNQYRQDSGLLHLVFVDDLNKTANLRLEELKVNFSHKSQGGYNTYLAENILKGIDSDQRAFSVWSDSSRHRANMLNVSYKYTGYAIGDGYAIQLFTPYQTINGEPQLPPGWLWDN